MTSFIRERRVPKVISHFACDPDFLQRTNSMAPHTASQSYLSTRGGTYGATFEEVVLQGLAPDGGLFIPEEIPALPSNWQTEWRDYSFEELAFEILSLYVSRDEVPHDALRDIIRRSYATFRVPEVTPTLALDQNRKIYLLELFHGQTFAFKDVALQFLGNLFEFFLVRKNEGKTAKEREHLTVIGATSGDTGSAAIYGEQKSFSSLRCQMKCTTATGIEYFLVFPK